MWCPAAFDAYAQRAIAEHVETLIEIDSDEAKQFAANAVVVGQTIVTNVGCDALHTKLRSAGFDTIATPLDEFVKAGGSAKCLTLRIDGEEAAAWKQAND